MRLKLRYYVCALDVLEADRPSSSGAGAGAGAASYPSSSSAGGARAGVTGLDVFASIRASIAEVHGEEGVGATMRSLVVKHYNPLTGLFVARGPQAWDRRVRACIGLVKSVKCGGRGKLPARIRVLHVAGSLRTLANVGKRWKAALAKAAAGRALPLAAVDVDERLMEEFVALVASGAAGW
jgi:hypothetical protein